jgi:hypothetical protein
MLKTKQLHAYMSSPVFQDRPIMTVAAAIAAWKADVDGKAFHEKPTEFQPDLDFQANGIPREFILVVARACQEGVILYTGVRGENRNAQWKAFSKKEESKQDRQAQE